MLKNGYDEDGNESNIEVMLNWPLNAEELKYIDAILERPDVDEEDAELLLTIMGTHARRVETRLPYILENYPHLTKNVFSFAASVADKDVLADMVLSHVKKHERLAEFQLFWLGAILEEHLMKTKKPHL